MYITAIWGIENEFSPCLISETWQKIDEIRLSEIIATVLERK